MTQLSDGDAESREVRAGRQGHRASPPQEESWPHAIGSHSRTSREDGKRSD